MTFILRRSDVPAKQRQVVCFVTLILRLGQISIQQIFADRTLFFAIFLFASRGSRPGRGSSLGPFSRAALPYHAVSLVCFEQILLPQLRDGAFEKCPKPHLVGGTLPRRGPFSHGLHERNEIVKLHLVPGTHHHRESRGEASVARAHVLLRYEANLAAELEKTDPVS